MAREIRGWQIGEVVTANYMTLNTANVLEEIGSNGEANLPCIYNGLTLQSQSGTGNSIITFNPGVARCQDLPLSTYTYLPPNAYGTGYPCYIDISILDSNTVITLATTPTSGYIVATFTINPTTSGAVDYVITGSLFQIPTASYNPQIHVRLCAYTYATSTFTLDFTPIVSRDTDMTGLGGAQWNYQNSSLEINTPSSQSGTAITLKQNTTVSGNLTVTGTEIIDSANTLQFNNSANSHFTSLGAGACTSNVNFKLPIADATSSGQFITSDMSGNLSFATIITNANVTPNDSNVVFTSASNPHQSCSTSAPRTYTLPTTGIPQGNVWTFDNQGLFIITVNSSNGNLVGYVWPKSSTNFVSLIATPVAASDWNPVYESIVPAIVQANDANTTFVFTDNQFQISNPTAARNYALPSSGGFPGYQFNFYNQATSSANYINLVSSTSQAICTIPPLGMVSVVATVTNPTNASQWIVLNRQSQWVAYTPTFSSGFGTTSSPAAYYKVLGDTVFVNGSVTAGTTTGAAGTISIPPGFAVLSTKLPLSSGTNLIGFIAAQDSSATGQLTPIAAQPGSSTSTVFLTSKVTGGNLLANAGTNVSITSGNPCSFEFSFPIV